jgi:hypothetical protein
VSPAASTTIWCDHHPITACTVTDGSTDTDRADLSRRDHLAATDFRLRSEVRALRVGVETDTAAARLRDVALLAAQLFLNRDALAIPISEIPPSRRPEDDEASACDAPHRARGEERYGSAVTCIRARLACIHQNVRGPVCPQMRGDEELMPFGLRLVRGSLRASAGV